jgi:spore coat polysaccharide biosynthesis protein SpsF (cytidylyltransferase family)
MLMELNGKTLLGRVIDRVKGAKKISKIIVATSTEKDDDTIEKFCFGEKIIMLSR